MNKAILILDMPKGCGQCKLRFFNGCNAIAENNYSGREITGSRQVRKKWCPLITEEQYIKSIYPILYDMVIRGVLAQRELAKKVGVAKVGEEE